MLQALTWDLHIHTATFIINQGAGVERIGSVMKYVQRLQGGLLLKEDVRIIIGVTAKPVCVHIFR